MTFGNMQKPLATGIDAIALIPQKPPFVLIDTLISSTETTFCSAFSVPAEHVLVHNGALLEAGLMENAAQTAALGMGWTAKQKNEPPPLGFIGALTRVAFKGKASVGQRLETTVIVKHEIMNARILEATIQCEGEPIVQLELKVFIVDAPPS